MWAKSDFWIFLTKKQQKKKYFSLLALIYIKISKILEKFNRLLCFIFHTDKHHYRYRHVNYGGDYGDVSKRLRSSQIGHQRNE